MNSKIFFLIVTFSAIISCSKRNVENDINQMQSLFKQQNTKFEKISTLACDASQMLELTSIYYQDKGFYLRNADANNKTVTNFENTPLLKEKLDAITPLIKSLGIDDYVIFPSHTLPVCRIALIVRSTTGLTPGEDLAFEFNPYSIKPFNPDGDSFHVQNNKKRYDFTIELGKDWYISYSN
ncbi:hypothetical protein [Pseudoalteromonas gelatinilytica]|tara:strand:+ start:1525 stop:2067 length:543 start_codon:yes stop_codon:yes gene_type:complete